MHEVGAIFAELGISQYLNDFLEQGFDTWETILDITESDLWVPIQFLSVFCMGSVLIDYSDALKVKLGHRRVRHFTFILFYTLSIIKQASFR